MKSRLFIILFLLSNSIFSQIAWDVDNNSYRTVVIGEQEWFAENLRTTRFNDGNRIFTEKDSLDWIEIDFPAYCWYKNDSITYKYTYGALYNWYAAQNDRLCPMGWRVATQEDFLDLIKFLDPSVSTPVLLSETAGKLLKQTIWPPYENIEATNSTGFSAIGAGCRGWNGWHNSAPYFGYFWTSGSNWSVALRWATDRVFMNDGAAPYVAISVRCVRKYDVKNIFLPIYAKNEKGKEDLD